MPLVDLFHREPAALLHQVNEAKVSRAENDDLLIGYVVLGTLWLFPRGLGKRVPDHRVLFVASGEVAHAVPCQAASDEIVEAVAVPLLERRALGLTMVGEDDDFVGPRRIAACTFDPGELLVELAQSLERVRPLEPRMVRDLVVARKRRVDRRPSLHEIGEHTEDDQVADDHAHRPAHERIDATSMPPRTHVATDRATSCNPLENDLPQEQNECAGHVLPVREERPVARVRPLFGFDAADGEDHVLGLTRQEVPAARTPVSKKPVPRVTTLDLGCNPQVSSRSS